MGKKMVASGNLPAGTVLTPEHIKFKSPGDGMFPDQLHEILGRELKSDVNEDQEFTEDLLG